MLVHKRSVWGFLALTLTGLGAQGGSPLPNILTIVADDLGHADVSWNNPDMVSRTPALGELLKEGVLLSSFYVQPVCSPTRGAFLTGRYPMRWALLHHTFNNDDRFSLFTNETLMPALLRERFKYRTHMVGKWHLGFSHDGNMPTSRGFDTFFGFLSGDQDYYYHNETDNTGGGYDLRNDTEPVRTLNGSYSTEIYSSMALSIVEDHARLLRAFEEGGVDSSEEGVTDAPPLFLYLAYQAVHSPSQVPSSYLHAFSREGGAHGSAESQKESLERETLKAMVKCMDDGIANLTHALRRTGLWNNTLLLFFSDNGGPVNGTTDHNGQCNYPLRGSKHTLWEGGVRVPALLSGGIASRLPGRSPGVAQTQRRFDGLMHVVDVLPTFLHMISSFDGVPGRTEPSSQGKEAPFPLDGVSAWDTWSQGGPSTRTEVFLNYDPLASSGTTGCCGFAGLRWDTPPKSPSKSFTHEGEGKQRHWKLLVDPGDPNGIYTCPDADVQTDSGGALRTTLPEAERLNAALSVELSADSPIFFNRSFYLFDLATDPLETVNVLRSHPEVVVIMLGKLRTFIRQAMPDGHCDPDPASKPKTRTGSEYDWWGPWLSDSENWCYVSPTAAPTAYKVGAQN